MSATTFVRMPSAKQMAMMGIPDLPEAAFGGDIPPMQRKALVKAMGIRPQKGGGLTAVVAVVAAVAVPFVAPADRKSTRLNSSHSQQSRMPSSA